MPLVSTRARVELRRARKWAVIVVIGIVAAIAAAVELLAQENVQLPWQSWYVAHVAVNDATGVAPGLDQVRWAGIVVGDITGEKLENGRPVLTLQMNPGKLDGARLYRDAVLQLRPATPLQDMYMDVISRGHPAAGRLGPNEVLPAEDTQTPVNVADVLDTFSEPVVDRFQELLDELATGLSPSGGQQLRYAFGEIAPMLEAQKVLSNTVAQRKTIVAGLVHDSRLLFDELAARDADLSRLLQTGAATFQAVGSESPALRQLIAGLPPTLTQMQGSFARLDVTLADVRPALTALLPAARALPSGLSALRRFSLPATPALRSLDPALEALGPLARNLAPTATALHSAFNGLDPQAPRFDRITAKVVPCELPVDKFFAWTLSVFKFGNAGNRSASPRGQLVVPLSEVSAVKDPTLEPATGCADGAPPPK
ncbi:MAG TPA: hypothetical protein VHX88_10175 [Solirubrobacteraceae bacterium]|jgi:phospholipid/cholesterol/gamma-HCH transport system substrate-binding protein|nr:hypothetical protein [Solirubrobacteraceae bacterium]